MNKNALSFLFFMIVISSFAESAERCPRCRRMDCEYANDGTYDPYARYYPYCMIYQDSRVKSFDSDAAAGEGYWPARRDDDFVDALTR